MGGRAPPYAVRLSPDQARDLAQTGGALLLLGVPPGTVLGVDHQARASPERGGVVVEGALTLARCLLLVMS